MLPQNEDHTCQAKQLDSDDRALTNEMAKGFECKSAGFGQTNLSFSWPIRDRSDLKTARSGFIARQVGCPRSCLKNEGHYGCFG